MPDHPPRRYRSRPLCRNSSASSCDQPRLQWKRSSSTASSGRRRISFKTRIPEPHAACAPAREASEYERPRGWGPFRGGVTATNLRSLGRALLLRSRCDMARMAVRWLVLVGLALILPSVVSAQRSGELVFGVLTAGFSDGYVVPIPAAQFVFFQGETIRLHIVVANTTSTPQIDTAGLPVTSAFRLVDRDRAGQSTQLAVSPMGSIGVAVTAKTVRWG